MLPQQRGQTLPSATFFVTAIWEEQECRALYRQAAQGNAVRAAEERKEADDAWCAMSDDSTSQVNSGDATRGGRGGGGVSRSRGRGGGGWGSPEGEALVPHPPPLSWLRAQQRPRRWQGGRMCCCPQAIRAPSWYAKGCIKAILRLC